jgi:hypothetical protein
MLWYLAKGVRILGVPSEIVEYVTHGVQLRNVMPLRKLLYTKE